jgi:hypothetical protein
MGQAWHQRLGFWNPDTSRFFRLGGVDRRADDLGDRAFLQDFAGGVGSLCAAGGGVSGHDKPGCSSAAPIAVAADIEKLAALRGMTSSSTEGEFQGTSRPFPKAGLDNAPVSWQACSVSDYGSFTEALGTRPRSLQRSGFLFFTAFVPPPYHDLGPNRPLTNKTVGQSDWGNKQKIN